MPKKKTTTKKTTTKKTNKKKDTENKIYTVNKNKIMKLGKVIRSFRSEEEANNYYNLNYIS